jgi:hypothetical protein
VALVAALVAPVEWAAPGEGSMAPVVRKAAAAALVVVMVA